MMSMEALDHLYHYESAPDRYWSTANVGEALPGVVTPLGWSVWGPSIELGMRDAFAKTGALERSRVVVPANTSDRVVSLFHGRGALSVSFLCEMGDRLPGTSGDAIARQLLGWVPEELRPRRDLSRMPMVAVNMPYALAMIHRQVMADTAPTAAWWSAWLKQIPALDMEGLKRALDDARKRQILLTATQARGVFVGVQSVYDQLLALIEKAGLDSTSANALMAGQGSHAETEIIADIWDLGRGRIAMETFLERHGYHGPAEGQMISRMWREDPSPVQRLAAQYAGRPDSDHPAATAKQRTEERVAAERELLSRLSRSRRPVAQFILRLAAQRIPLRGVAKEALIRALDVVRATGRRMGDLYVEQGVLDEADDALFFTADELIAGLPADAQTYADERRAERDRLLQLDVPKHWAGVPEAVPIETPGEGERQEGSGGAGSDISVSGIAASGGVVEGKVRIVHDPAFTDVEDGEIIVCPTTDPSWASVLFLCSALVVDIGGPLSHAAVVAREVGIPCVIGTGNGTGVLRTGDEVRVDGDNGTVEILTRTETTV